MSKRPGRPENNKKRQRNPNVFFSISIPYDVLVSALEHGEGDSRSSKIVYFVKKGLESKGVLKAES